MAVSNINETPLRYYNIYPNFIKDGNVVFNYAATSPEEKTEDGWRDIIVPEYDKEKFKLGNLIYDAENDSVTYELVELTETEVLAKKSRERDNALIKAAKEKIQQEAQGLSDQQAKDNQILYPFWNEIISKSVPLDFKCQYFDNSGDLILWKCITAHTVQSDWQPKDSPSLWVKTWQEGTIPVWEKPTGAHDAYKEGDIVWYPTENSQKYKSMMNGNVYSPDEYPQGWELQN